MPMVSSPRAARLGERGEQVARVAAGREAERDVAGVGVGDQLAREHEVEPDVVAERGQHRGVVDEAPGGERLAPRRPGEQRGQRRGVGGAAAVAEREQPAAPREPRSPWPRRPRRSASADCVERRVVAVGAGLRLGLAPTARSSEQRIGVALVGLDERIEEVRRLAHGDLRRSAIAGVDEHEVAGSTAATIVVSTASTPGRAHTRDRRRRR